ncbi:MAG: hypothetical protein HQ546_04265, partial [Planctomycetes bacterium]|nr:hypothetical protein [Planctomycetota bacterium]
AVLGGLHLRSCNQGQFQDVANFLQDAGRPDLFLGHCTGERAEAFFADNYEGLVKPLAVGDNLHF